VGNEEEIDAREIPQAARFQAMAGLRIVVAGLIVVFHAASSGAGTGLDADAGVGAIFSLLDVGVPIFFVLSGFLLYRPMVQARLTGTPRKSMGRYGWHRFRRIAPAYWVVLFTAAALGHAELGTGSQPWRIAGFLQIYDPILFTAGLVVAWSLCTEVAFYVYLPVHDRVLSRSKGSPAKRALGEWVACGVLILISLVFKIWMYGSGELSRSAYLPRYIDAFAVGMAFAILSVVESNRRGSGRIFTTVRKLGALPWAAAGGLIFLLSLHTFPAYPDAPAAWESIGRDLVKVVVAGLVVLPLVVDREAEAPLGAFLAQRPLRFWGELSFGVFLIHLPLLGWIQDQMDQPAELLPTLWLAIVAFLASSALALVLYLVVERPMQRLEPFAGPARERRRARKRATGVVADGQPEGQLS
jgi:peptidoglycan/LPS O-acetylase OafA/YrhL